MQAPTTISRSSRWIVAPALGVLLLGVAWSGGWFYAARRAEATINAWIEREARDGRVYNCARRSHGGFPFRIELQCTDLTAEFRTLNPPMTLRAANLMAVSQVYQPDLLIAEVTGPLSAGPFPDGSSLTANWRLLQASVSGRPSSLDRISLVTDDATMSRSQAGTSAPAVQLQHLEFHLRPDPGTPHAFDIANEFSRAVVSGVPGLSAQPISGRATAVLRGVQDFAPKPLPDRLREWQTAGGRFELATMRLQQGEMIATAKGSVGLTAAGRPDGGFDVVIAGLEQVVGLLFGQSEPKSMQAGVVAALTMLSRSELEGRRAVTVPLRLRDGAVSFGPIPVGRIGPLY